MNKALKNEAPRTWFVWTEVGVAFLLYGLLSLLLVALPLSIVHGLGFHPSPRQGASVSLAGTLVSALLAFAGLGLWLRRRSVPLRSLGFIRPIRWSPVGLATGFALAYAGATLTIPEVRCHAGEISVFKAWGVFASVVGAVIEETVFRGFILTELHRVGSSPWIQVIVSCLTFGLLHLGYNWRGVFSTTLMGMVLALTYLWSGRSLLAPLVGHALINIVVEPWLLVYVITCYAGAFPK
jgi:membrane protease YdiL (CAAX protease family)